MNPSQIEHKTPSTELEAKELTAKIDAALGTLPPRTAQVLEDLALGAPIGEVAEATGMTKADVNRTFASGSRKFAIALANAQVKPT